MHNLCQSVGKDFIVYDINLTLSLIDADFTFSMDEGATWVTGATITSLAPQGTSSSIIIKNTIPPPTQLLGPRAPRLEVTIGSWS